MPFYLTDVLGLPEPVMGAVLALNPALQSLLMSRFGGVADAVGRKPLITAGMAGSGAFAVVIAAATVSTGGPAVSAAVVGAGYVVLAAAFSSMWTGTVAFVGDVAPVERESELMGLLETARSLGGVVGPPVIGVAATVAGFAPAFVAGSVLAFAASGFVAASLEESRPTR
jgi:MFS family permease